MMWTAGRLFRTRGSQRPGPVLLSMVVVILAVFGTPSAIPASATAPQEPNVEVERLADGVYLYTYNVHRSLFIVTGDSVLATDPQSAQAAERYVQEIRKITSAPIRYLVYSHHHGDHVSGGATFGDDVVIVGHRNIVDHLSPDSAVAPLDVTFEERASILLGDLEIQLIYPGPSETDSSIIVYVPARRVAFMVDAVSVRTVPWRNMADANPFDWIEALRYLDALDFDILAPGHGPTGSKAHVAEYIRYMTDLVDAVRQRMDRGESLEQMQENLELAQYADWTRYDQHFELNIEGVYRELSRGSRSRD